MHVLDDLAEEFADLRTQLQPLLGLLLGGGGDPRALHDVSLHGEAGARERLADLARRVADIPVDGLDATRATTRLMLLTELDNQLAAIDLRTVELTADSFVGGAQAVLLHTIPKTPITGPDDAHALIDRLRAIPTFLEQSLDRLRHGALHDRAATQLGVRGSIAQSRGLAALTPAESPLLLPLTAHPDALAEASKVLLSQVHPALEAFADGLEHDVLPHARPDDRVGLAHLRDGKQLYAQALRQHVTMEVDPDEIHKIGLDVITGLADEYATAGKELFGTDDLIEIFRHLRDDPSLRYETGEQARLEAEKCIARAAAVIGDWVGRNPLKPCIVTPMPAAAAGGMTVAYYQPPAGPDAPSGIYWINTTGPVVSRYEAEVVAFHEAIPGHHTQLALQAELDLPRFRQAGLLLGGFQEGWGLYTERLCDEIGLYSGPLGRLGMLAMDSLRGCRLVVDTGIHHFGWSRQQALDYLLANAPVTEDFALAEIDRYCVYPGQACSYMLGRHEIARLRQHAHDSLGDRFDIRAFHDVILGQGSVPLSVLAANVDAWLSLHSP